MIRDHYYEPMFRYDGDYKRLNRADSDFFGFNLESQMNFLQNSDFSSELEELAFLGESHEPSSIYFR